MHSTLLVMVCIVTTNMIFFRKQHFGIFLSTLIWTLHELGIFHNFCSNTVIRTYTTIRHPRVCAISLSLKVLRNLWKSGYYQPPNGTKLIPKPIPDVYPSISGMSRVIDLPAGLSIPFLCAISLSLKVLRNLWKSGYHQPLNGIKLVPKTTPYVYPSISGMSRVIDLPAGLSAPFSTRDKLITEGT